MQLVQLQELKAKLDPLGVQIIAICADRPPLVRATIKRNKLTYAMLSDSKMYAARGFRLSYVLSKKLQAVYKTYDVDIIEASGQDHQQLPVPGVFVIAKGGKVLYRFYNADEKIRLAPEDLLAEIEGLAKDGRL